MKTRGFTVVELLVVISVIALLGGIAVGMIKRQDKSLVLEANSRLIRSTLRLARASARDSRVGAMVVIRKDPPELEVFPAAVGGNWHFEDASGAFGSEIPGGFTSVEGGVLGRCAEISGGALDLGAFAWQVATSGFRFTFWVNPRQLVASELASRTRLWSITLQDDGALAAQIKVVSGAAGQERVESVALETRGGLVRPGRWQEVTLIHDGVEARLEVNGVPFAKRAETRGLPADWNAPILIGGRGFVGLIDEVRLDVVNSQETDSLNPRVLIESPGDVLIRFDGVGRLDRRYHQRAVDILLSAGEEESRREDTIRVEMTGVIR